MLKLSKITLLLLGALGISSLSGCGTLALLNQCATETGTNAICPDEPLYGGPGHIQTEDVVVNSDTLAKLAGVVQSENVVGTVSAVLANIEKPTIPTGFAEHVAYTEITPRNHLDNGGFAFYSIDNDSIDAPNPDDITQDGSALENPLLFYAGILPGTDVGNALRSFYDQTFNEYGGVPLSTNEEIPLIATWNAQIFVAVPQMSPQDYWGENNNDGGEYDYYRDVEYVQVESDPFDLHVNYKTQEINSGRIKVQAYGNRPSKTDATLSGEFGVSSGDSVGIGNHGLAPGQLRGTFDIYNDGDDKFPTPMTGIIGEKGAVGVFNGNYFGGFVASPR